MEPRASSVPRSRQTTNSRRWRFFALGARRPAWRIRSTCSVSRGRSAYLRTARIVRMASHVSTAGSLDALEAAGTAAGQPFQLLQRPPGLRGGDGIAVVEAPGRELIFVQAKDGP